MGGAQAEDPAKRRDTVQAATRGGYQAVPPATPGRVSVADERVRLAQLRDSGVLSPQEFEAQNARLLG